MLKLKDSFPSCLQIFAATVSSPFPFPLSSPLLLVPFYPSVSACAVHISNATSFSTVLICTSQSLFWNPMTPYSLLCVCVCVYWVSAWSTGWGVKWDSWEKAARRGFTQPAIAVSRGAQVWGEALGMVWSRAFFSNSNVLETQLGTFLHCGVRLIWAESPELASLTSSRVVVMWLARVPQPTFLRTVML